MSVVGDFLYVVGGYGNQNHYAPDIWRLRISCHHTDGEKVSIRKVCIAPFACWTVSLAYMPSQKDKALHIVIPVVKASPEVL